MTNRFGFVLATLLVAVVLAACGGEVVPVASDRERTASASVAASRTEPPDVVPIDCPAEMETLVDALQELDSRLTVGLSFQDYSDRVGDVQVAYDQLDVDDLGLDCLEDVGVQAEKALIAYVDAYNIWNDCISDVDCINDSITPDLQAKWAEATEFIEEARDGLDQ